MTITCTPDAITGEGFVITRTQLQANTLRYMDWLDEDTDRLDLDRNAHLAMLSEITAESLGWDEDTRRANTLTNEDYQKLINSGLIGCMMTLVSGFPEAIAYANRIADRDISLALLMLQLKGQIS